MPLPPDPTVDNALDQYGATVLTFRTSLAAAQDRLEAIDWLMANRPQLSAHSGSQMSFASLRAERREVLPYVKTAPNVRRSAFTRGRSLA